MKARLSEELRVLLRIAVRGRNLALSDTYLAVDSVGRMVDMWEHMETELTRLLRKEGEGPNV